MELTHLVLLILAIIYVPFYFWVRLSPKAEKYGLVKHGPLVMIKTQLGTKLMDRLCVYRRFWKFFGAVSIAISFMLMAFIILIIAVGISNLPSNINAPGIGIEYALAIPGLNPLLPFWYGWIALIVAMVIHELAHGMQTRANNMRVDSTGLLYGVVPLGAFVEPNEEDIEKSSRRVKLDLYSAGISTNFIAAIVAFAIFAVLMLGNISSGFGGNAAVYQISEGSPAHIAGIPSGAIIHSIDDEEYLYTEDFTVTYDKWKPGYTVNVKYQTEDGYGNKDVIWGLFIESISKGTPAEKYGLQEKTFIKSIDGQLIYGYSEFMAYMQTTTPNGEKVEIVCFDTDGKELPTVSLTLGDNGGIGFIGIVTSTSGMRFITPDMMLEAGRNPIHGAESVREGVTSLLSYIAGPFNGFSPMPESVHWWYDVPLGGLFWMLISLFYWIFWLNIMLGVSNAIPAYPFDGGYIFQGGLSALLQRLGMKDEKRREDMTTRITNSLSKIMIFLLLLVIIVVVI